MEFERYDDGVPSWVDMGSPDLAKSREFYEALFGWNCPEGPPEAGGYSVCDLGGKTVAGLGPQMNPDAPPAWMTYVNVDSADDTVAKVAANGGTVFMPPMDVMDAGRMAIFADPSWCRDRPVAAQAAHRVPSWPTSRAPTAGASSSRRTSTRRRPSTRPSSVGTPRTQGRPGGRRPTPSGSSMGRSVGGMMLKSPEMPAEMPPNWGVYFAVADTDATVAKAQELGGSAVHGPDRHRAGTLRRPVRQRRRRVQRPAAQELSEADVERRRLGRTEHESSVAVLGGAACWAATPEEAGDWLHLALDHGVNHLDIAPQYGAAESVVGPHLADAPGGALRRRQDAAGQSRRGQRPVRQHAATAPRRGARPLPGPRRDDAGGARPALGRARADPRAARRRATRASPASPGTTSRCRGSISRRCAASTSTR